MGLGIFHNGHLMLRADQVAEPADCHGAAPEVSELPCAVQAGGVPVNVVVDMPISRMGADDEGILSIPFRKHYLFHLPVVLSVIIRILSVIQEIFSTYHRNNQKHHQQYFFCSLHIVPPSGHDKTGRYFTAGVYRL